MKSENIDNLLIEFLDLIQSEPSKIELLNNAKSIKRLVNAAKAEAIELNEDSMDEISLTFGEKFFKILRG